MVNFIYTKPLVPILKQKWQEYKNKMYTEKSWYFHSRKEGHYFAIYGTKGKEFEESKLRIAAKDNCYCQSLLAIH